MTGSEIREKFLAFFEERGHTVVPSAPLVPQNDPTLLFTNAGMVQFKNVFLGQEKRPYTRAASAQKCLRAGGKHNDLEMVGRTARHHTFFEMLGNFSFGGYFKKEAIAYAWEFLTAAIGLPKDRLYASIYQEDDDAYQIWRRDIGLGEARIFRLGEKDNFWAMGNTGPCGPCSEIYIDQGEALGCGRPTCTVGCDCDRFLELWNLVFMQYDRDKAGKLSPLPSPCIDTGMGLERLTAVVQGRTNNYDSDLLLSLIETISEITGTAYAGDGPPVVSLRVIADHARSAAFLIADGVLPFNEGRGYVLRRIMRRALRHGKLLNQTEPFFHRVTDAVADRFQDAFPELKNNRPFIRKVVCHEEEGFQNTLNFGINKLDEILERLRQAKQTVIPGGEIFKLYDTYGFPVDLVEESAQDGGFSLDMDGFQAAMQEQKEKAMASWKGSGEKQIAPIFIDLRDRAGATPFLGYDGVEAEGEVIALVKGNREVDAIAEGDAAGMIVSRTPFYGESGGQVGDQGRAHSDKTQLEIVDTTHPVPGLILHKIKVTRGTLHPGDLLHLEVDAERRTETMLNHTATHLLHAALKEVLGPHVKQAGSLVDPGRLRFDYTHFSPLASREKERIEELVNAKIRENLPVHKEEMDIEQAIEGGAMALFGEKYGDRVRVVDVPGFSKELCGGTHVNATGDIGLFRITQETGIASGVRRIEAVTGQKSYARVRQDQQHLTALRHLLKAQPEEELSRLQKLLDRNKELEKEVASLKEKLVTGKQATGNLLDDVQKVGDVSLLVKKLEGIDAKTLRSFIDQAKQQIKSGIIVAGAQENGKALLAAGVTKDLTGRYHAGNILKQVAAIVGGKGGGRADMAQAGGAHPEKLDAALQAVPQFLQ